MATATLTERVRAETKNERKPASGVVELKPDRIDVLRTSRGDDWYMVVGRTFSLGIFGNHKEICTELYAHEVSREDAKIIARSYARAYQAPAYINCGTEQRRLYRPGDGLK